MAHDFGCLDSSQGRKEKVGAEKRKKIVDSYYYRGSITAVVS
jgi:hypothetical protein